MAEKNDCPLDIQAVGSICIFALIFGFIVFLVAVAYGIYFFFFANRNSPAQDE